MIALLLLACAAGDGPAASNGAYAEDFAGPVGRVLEFVPPGAPTDPTVVLVVLDGAWEVQDVDGAVTPYVTHLGRDGFRVDEVLVLPPRLDEGKAAEGAEVVAVGSFETHYGIFPDTVTVHTTEGDFAGDLVFARDVGLIALAWNGWAGELAYYE